MRFLTLACLLLTTLAWSQGEPVSPPQPDLPPEYRPPVLRDNEEKEAFPASAAKVPPDAAVITIKGVCAHPPTTNAGSVQAPCQTVITRAQFEKLTEALLTNMKPSRKRQVANGYPNLLAMAQEAEARGLDKTERFEERLAYARVQILSQELIRQIDDNSANVPAKDIEDYYQTHTSEFQSVTLERVFIPNRKRMEPLPKDKATPEALTAQKKESEQGMARLADQLRAKALAGADLPALQKEAYAAAGATDVPPNASLGRVYPGGLPPAHASVFDLKPGEVSPVISDSTGHYIYKVDAKQNEPLDAAKDEIHKTLQNQRREESIQAVQRPITTELNPAYFGPTEKQGGSDGPKSK